MELFCIKNRLDAERVIWEWPMARLLQIIHADGCSKGNIYRWSKYYDAPELEAQLDAAMSNKPSIEELDP